MSPLPSFLATISDLSRGYAHVINIHIHKKNAISSRASIPPSDSPTWMQ